MIVALPGLFSYLFLELLKYINVLNVVGELGLE